MRAEVDHKAFENNGKVFFKSSKGFHCLVEVPFSKKFGLLNRNTKKGPFVVQFLEQSTDFVRYHDLSACKINSSAAI